MLTELLPLRIFPEGALASSIVTTVWVGIFVVCFCNLRLGWVLSGLVVPGYMAPLLFLKPSAAAVVFGEGVITYFLVWFYSEFRGFGFSGGRRTWKQPSRQITLRILCNDQHMLRAVTIS